MPSERPTRPSPTNRSMNSGRAASSSANSSTITSRSGIGGSDGSLLAARLVGDDVVDVAGLAQHRLAALLLADQRVAHAVDEREVALQVGDQARDVREPRRGRRTRRRPCSRRARTPAARARGVAARPATSERSSSLLPEPVAPTSTPCGPMPPSAACLRSSSSTSPSARAADRRAQRLGARAAPLRRAPGELVGDCTPSSSTSRTLAPSPRSPSPAPSASRSGVSVRAIASAMPRSTSSRNTSGIDGASWPHELPGARRRARARSAARRCATARARARRSAGPARP